jgi:hypothetical protein
MKARRFLLAAAVMAAAFAFLALHYFGRAQAARARIAVLQDEMRVAQARRTRLAEHLKVAQAKVSARARAATATNGGGNWLERARTDPAVQNRLIAYEKSGLGMRYGPLFKALGLTPDQVARCEDNLSKRDELYMDLDEAMRSQGIAGGPAAAQLYDQMFAGYHADQLALLGPDGVQKLKDYDTAFPSTAMVNGMAGGATVAGIPLTPEQLQQLSGAVLAATRVTSATVPDGIDWAAVDAKEAGLLTPAQLNLLQNADFLGPFGMGSRFQFRLNNLITQADQADRTAAPAPGG